MKNNKGFAPVLILIAVLAVLAIGGGAYYARKDSNNSQKLQQENQDNITVPSLYGAIIVYKTKEDYSNLVSADLDITRQVIDSYPMSNEIQPPVSLHNNYFTGGFGGDPYGVFLSMTITDYKNLTKRLSKDQIFKLILDKSPFLEMYSCFIAPVDGKNPTQAYMYNVANSYIDNNQLSSKCEKTI